MSFCVNSVSKLMQDGSVSISQTAAAAIIRFINNLIPYSGERNVPKLANICFCFGSFFFILVPSFAQKCEC